MTTLTLINGPEQVYVGARIWHSAWGRVDGPNTLTTEVLAIEGDRVTWRVFNADGSFAGLPYNIGHINTLINSGFHIVNPEPKMLEYDPMQQGDTDDDI